MSSRLALVLENMSPATSVLKQPDDYFYSKTRCSRLINNYARNIAISFNDTIRLEASSQQVPVLPRSQVLDLCNKSVAIYDIAPNDRGTNAITLHDYIYRLWVNDWETDIEFGRFPAKYIRVSSDTREGMPSVQRILDLHNALCKQAQCSDDDFDKLEETVTGGSRHSKLHRQYYGLEPVFQSLIIVIEDNATNVGPPAQIK